MKKLVYGLSGLITGALILVQSQVSFAVGALDGLADALEKEAEGTARRSSQQSKPTQRKPDQNLRITQNAKPPVGVDRTKPAAGQKQSTVKHTEKQPRLNIQGMTPTNEATAVEMRDSLEPKWNRLKLCLTNLKTDMRYQSTDEAKQNLDEYVDRVERLLTNIDANRSKKTDEERRRLVYANWIISSKLSECIDLSDGPEKNRYIYLVGQQAKLDGKVFETVAGTLASEMVKRICPSYYDECLRQVIVKFQVRKNEILNYFKLLSPGSLKYLSYVGHGWSSGFLLGFKDMSVPADWQVYSKITNLEWQAERQGAFYADDMNYVGPIIAKALDPQGVVAIYACDVADELGPNLAGQLPETVTVLASESGMEYKTLPGTDSWSFVLSTGERFNGPKILMIPSTKGAFKKLKPRAFKYSIEISAPEASEPEKKAGNGYDDMASAVLTRVGRKEAWFNWIGETSAKPDSAKRLIVFDNRDRTTISAIFEIPLPGHGVYEDDLEITFSQYDEKVKTVLKARSGFEKTYLEDLFERINACIEDGVQKYY